MEISQNREYYPIKFPLFIRIGLITAAYYSIKLVDHYSKFFNLSSKPNWIRIPLHSTGIALTVYMLAAYVTEVGIYVSLYPGMNVGDFGQRTSWEGEPTWVIFDNRARKARIETRYLEGTPGQPHSGETILFSPANYMGYDSFAPAQFDRLRAVGYSIALYNPPEYGRSTGFRRAASDFDAIEAFIDHLKVERGLQIEQLHLVGKSLGSGPVSYAASRHRVRSLLLCVPIGRTQDVVRRVLKDSTGPLGSAIATTLSDPVVQLTFNYDNVKWMEMCQAGRVRIVDAAQDHLMTLGGVPEGEKLFNAWRGAPDAIERITHPDAGHNSPEVETIRTIEGYLLP